MQCYAVLEADLLRGKIIRRMYRRGVHVTREGRELTVIGSIKSDT
jgi:hypothetical protein